MKDHRLSAIFLFVTLLFGAFMLGGYLQKSQTPTELQFIPQQFSAITIPVQVGDSLMVGTIMRGEYEEVVYPALAQDGTIIYMNKAYVAIEDSTKAKEAGWLLAGIEQGKMAVARRVK